MEEEIFDARCSFFRTRRFPNNYISFTEIYNSRGKLRDGIINAYLTWDIMIENPVLMDKSFYLGGKLGEPFPQVLVYLWENRKRDDVKIILRRFFTKLKCEYTNSFDMYLIYCGAEIIRLAAKQWREDMRKNMKEYLFEIILSRDEDYDFSEIIHALSTECGCEMELMMQYLHSMEIKINYVGMTIGKFCSMVKKIESAGKK